MLINKIKVVRIFYGVVFKASIKGLQLKNLRRLTCLFTFFCVGACVSVFSFLLANILVHVCEFELIA